MLYAEDTLAEIVQHAAEAGKVAGLLGSDVMTDATSSHEWEGRPKLYVIREQSEAIPDLADPFGYSGTLNSRITLAAILRAFELQADTMPVPSPSITLRAGAGFDGKLATPRQHIHADRAHREVVAWR